MIVQLSDFHVGARGGTDPVRDARAAVEAVLALRPRPDAVLVSGDLADHGTPQEYRTVRDLLDALPVPVHVLPGNHDAREPLRDAFPAPGAPADPYRWSAHCGGLRVVGCDTTRPGRDDGDLSRDELGALRVALAEMPEVPTLVALHHPPIAIGVPALDRIALAPAAAVALGELLADFPFVRRVVAGHVHMAAAGQVGGCPVATSPSTWRTRLDLDFEAEDFSRIVETPAGMLVHALVDGSLVTHAHPL